MKIVKKITCVLIILSIFFPKDIFAILSPEQNKAILQNFKKRSTHNIFNDNDYITWSWEVLMNSIKKADLFSALSKNANEERQNLEKQSQIIASRINSLVNSIEVLDKDINEQVKQISTTNVDITKTKTDIEKWKKVIWLIQLKIKENKGVLLDYINHIYKQWNYTYNDWEIDNVKSVILNWENIWEILNNLHFKSIIEVTWQKLVEKNRLYVKALYLKKLELEENEKKLVTLRNDLIIEKKSLDDKRKFREEILENTKGKEELYKSYIAEKLKVENSFKIKEIKANIAFNNEKNKILEKYNCESVDIFKEKEKLSKLSQECADVNKIIYWETLLQKKSLSQDNPLIWPVSPDRWITAFFHDVWYKKAIWDDHDAIDIRASQWTRIKAPADWYVIFVAPPVSSDYSYMAIKHSNWLVSVYWHLSEIMVEKYDFIRKWQVFAKSGWEFGTKWAWLMTTWPHLHFEIYADKSYTDPLNYVDLTSLNINDLPQKYRIKYYKDFKNKYGFHYKDNNYISSSLLVYWANEMERQKSLLKNYAVWDFKDWNIWVEESLDWNVDPTFVICIWMAESTLWKYLKTPNNIWNVWNTDSWATKTMSSARNWVKSIVQTLNNKFLWHYNEIRELSRYWNSDWAIYASSELNWHNNVTKCMSVVKQRNIPDDYKFRLNNY